VREDCRIETEQESRGRRGARAENRPRGQKDKQREQESETKRRHARQEEKLMIPREIVCEKQPRKTVGFFPDTGVVVEIRHGFGKKSGQSESGAERRTPGVIELKIACPENRNPGGQMDVLVDRHRIDPGGVNAVPDEKRNGQNNRRYFGPREKAI
jgi:hypothetical protein